MTPEYLHVLLNPLPIYGTFAGILALLLSLLPKWRAGRPAALVVIFLCTAAVWPVEQTGEAAESRMLNLLDPDGEAWLEAHEEKAEQWMPVFYICAAASLAALLLPMKWPRASTPLALLTLLLAAATLFAGAQIAHPAGRIRHMEFRDSPPPVH